MPLVKLVAASLLIPIGIGFLLTAATELVNSDETRDISWVVVIGDLLLGTPAVAGGVLLGMKGLQNLVDESGLESRRGRERRLESVFLYLVQQYHRPIALTHFVHYTQVNPQVAQQFLDRKALEHEIRIERQANGEVLYWF